MKNFLLFVSGLFISLNAFSATFIVTQTSGDATVSGSLAWAIAQANLTTTADVISFSGIPAGTTSITGTNIPDITEEVHIDGSTWLGYSATGAHLTVNLVSAGFDFLNAGADGSTLDGLSITGNFGPLVTVNNADNVTIADNYFHLASNGTTQVANASANVSVRVTNSDNTIINDNVFALGTGTVAVSLIAGATNTDITNNSFGVGADGTTNIGGDNIAIDMNGAGINEILVQGNVIGNTTGISVDINGGTTNIDVLDNKIGFLSDGTTAAPNGGMNIAINGGASTILIDGNVIGNTTQHGIQINGASSITITDNIIDEVDRSGITLTNASGINTITGNTISNSGIEGIWYTIGSATANISGNSISCSVDGAEEGSGIVVQDPAGPDPNPVTTPPFISVNNGNTVSGTSTANARIDIFRKDPSSTCANCEGEIFMASVTADGSGNWTYTHNSGWPTGSTSGLVSATATINNITSEFADLGGAGMDATTGCMPVTATLSVEFYSFIVNKGIYGNHLRWMTAKPENSEYFIIERSDNGSSNFESIGELYPTTSTTFNFIDSKPLIGVNYYRIKQIDASNAITYSAIIKVDDSDNDNSKLVSIYPNPTQNKMVYFKLDHSLIDPSLSIKVFSSVGQLVKEINSFKGDFIDLSDHPQGAYLVVITTETEVISKPIILQ